MPQEGSKLSSQANALASKVGSVSALEATKQPRHRWYFFKEGFSPDVVRSAIQGSDCEAGGIVVDPFCGSGTVPLQSAIQGNSAAGVEVNPFLAFVARAKLLDCAPKSFETYANRILSSTKPGRRSPLENFSTFSPSGRDKSTSRWLFNTEVLRAFEAGLHAVGRGYRPSQQLTKLCLIGAAMDVCNAVKDGKALRYRKKWREEAFNGSDFRDAMEARIRNVAEDLKALPLPRPLGKIRVGDARNRIDDNQFRLCVTSPPYLNSFDYTDVYRPELFLGRWIQSMPRLRALRKRTLRSHVQTKWRTPNENESFGANYADVMSRIRPLRQEMWDQRIPEMIQAYFEDMRRVFSNLRKAAAPEARAWIVISTSAYAGVEIPVDLILADIASTAGWYLREVSVLRYLGRVAGQQWTQLSHSNERRQPHLRESLIVLDASEPR